MCKKVEFCVIQKWIDIEISMKLCALLALDSCAKGAQHQNKQKQLYMLVNTLLCLL